MRGRERVPVASEILSVPEAHIPEVIGVIRRGLEGAPRGLVSRDVRQALTRWCAEEEAYLRGLSANDDESEDEKRAADVRIAAETERLDAECTCNHSLRQHKGRIIGGKCWACARCRGFEPKAAKGVANARGKKRR
jgi:hypothetical protein